MERHDEVAAGLEPVRGGRGQSVDPRPHRHERVDHRVAHLVDHPLRPALGQQVVARLGRVDEQQLRHLVGDHAVQLLGHRAVEAAEARLDVPHGDQQLGGHDRPGHRRVDVAGDQHDVRRRLEQHRFQPLHHTRGLLRVRSRADVEVVVGLPHAQLVQEHLRHRVVVVLAGMHDELLELVRPPRKLGDDRRGLHEVRARPDDGHDPAATAHALSRRPVPGARRPRRSSRGRPPRRRAPRAPRSGGPAGRHRPPPPARAWSGAS